MISKKFKFGSYIALAILAGTFFACAKSVPRSLPVDVSLPDQTLKAVNESVLEVVVLKPEKDSMVYEKPLPLDLLPYAVRIDKYYSIGTAFAISPTQFATAAHVLLVGEGSQFRDVYLRDGKGNVYPVDQVVKYSRNRDFAVFTVKNWSGNGLPLNTDPQINQKVFAVGNALAEGIVIRDGLYTSNTPEEEEGAWRWLRFSAAASPGNSGGPLLDKNGNVIGIVLRKSENENLNYALPIAEVMKAPGKAVIHIKMKYLLENMDMTSVDTLHEEIGLPLSYRELDKKATAVIARFSDALLKRLLSENRTKIFPNGESASLLNKNYNAIFPHIIMKGDDGNWDAFMPKETKNADLGNNGYLSYGGIGRTLYFYMHKPDDVSMKSFTNDSKLFMDLLLKGIYGYREIGSEKVKIVSMGKAHEENRYTDSYGRKWTIRTWKQEYSDQVFAVFSMPVPGGSISMLRVDNTGSVYDSHIPDLKALCDFIYLSYYGSFKEWKELLALQDLLPSAFSSLRIRIENGKTFTFNSKRFSASYGADLMNITDSSDLNLRFGYFKDGTKVVWDIGGIVAGEDKNNKNCFTVFRLAMPPRELPDSFQSNWKNAVQQKFPYDHAAYFKDGDTAISTVYTGKAPRSGNAKLYYTVGYLMNGKIEQEQMASKLDGFLKNLNVPEMTDQALKTDVKASK